MCISAPCEFLDVVHHGIEMELSVHLGLASQRESAQALVVAQVAKGRLDHGKALGEVATLPCTAGMLTSGNAKP